MRKVLPLSFKACYHRGIWETPNLCFELFPILQDFLCSKLIEEDNFSENVFLSTIENLSQNDRILDSMKSNFKKIDIPDTLSMISSFILAPAPMHISNTMKPVMIIWSFQENWIHM